MSHLFAIKKLNLMKFRRQLLTRLLNIEGTYFAENHPVLARKPLVCWDSTEYSTNFSRSTSSNFNRTLGFMGSNKVWSN